MVDTSNSAGSAAWLAARSLLWTVLFPGVFAGYVPWRFLGISRVQVSLLWLAPVLARAKAIIESK